MKDLQNHENEYENKEIVLFKRNSVRALDDSPFETGNEEQEKDKKEGAGPFPRRMSSNVRNTAEEMEYEQKRKERASESELRLKRQAQNDNRWRQFEQLYQEYKYDETKTRTTLILIDGKDLNQENKVRLIKEYETADEDYDLFVGDVLPQLWQQITQGWKQAPEESIADPGQIDADRRDGNS